MTAFGTISRPLMAALAVALEQQLPPWGSGAAGRRASRDLEDSDPVGVSSITKPTQATMTMVPLL
jgi:hypothetical protein